MTRTLVALMMMAILTTSAMQPALSASVPVTAMAWRYTLPATSELTTMLLAGDQEIVGGTFGVTAFDARTGAIRWHRSEPAGFAAAVSGETLYLSSPDGSVVARSAHAGTLRWQNSGVCPIEGGRIAGVRIIKVFENDLLVGCGLGKVVRIDGRTGSILAQNDTLVFEGITAIKRLGSCAYGLSLYSTGAVYRSYSAIVQCRTLATILPEQEGTTILGSVGNEAVIDDKACASGGDANCPDTISRVDLATGRRTDGINLTGNASNAWQPSFSELVAGRLYLFLNRDPQAEPIFTIDDYGDPRAISPPRRVAGGLLNATMAGDRTAIVQTQANGDAGSRYALLRLDAGAATTLWSHPAPASRIPTPVVSSGAMLDESASPVAVTVTSADGADLYLRLRDRRELYPDRTCTPVHADDDLLLLSCTTNKLVGNRYVMYLAAFRW